MISNGDIRSGIDYLEDVGIGVLKLFFNIGLNCFSNENIQDCTPGGDGEDKGCCKYEEEL